MKFGKVFWIITAAAVSLAACATQPAPESPTAVLPQPTATAPSAVTPQPTDDSYINYPEPKQTTMAVADEYFQRGYAVWLKDWGQIWIFVQPIVMPGSIEVNDELVTPDLEPQVLTNGGPWYRFGDTFDPATDLDSDPALVPPANMQQPKGGIGKIWRENPELQAALGWALDWEKPYKTLINEYAIGVLGKEKGFVPTGRIFTLYTSDGALVYVHEEAGIWSRP